jgi:hypothetical protein
MRYHRTTAVQISLQCNARHVAAPVHCNLLAALQCWSHLADRSHAAHWITPPAHRRRRCGAAAFAVRHPEPGRLRDDGLHQCAGCERCAGDLPVRPGAGRSGDARDGRHRLVAPCAADGSDAGRRHHDRRGNHRLGGRGDARRRVRLRAEAAEGLHAAAGAAAGHGPAVLAHGERPTRAALARTGHRAGSGQPRARGLHALRVSRPALAARRHHRPVLPAAGAVRKADACAGRGVAAQDGGRSAPDDAVARRPHAPVPHGPPDARAAPGGRGLAGP